MFGRHFRSESNKAQGDARLSALLHEWKGVEPPANFEAAVRRRIRVVPATESRGLSLIEIGRDWIAPHPVWVNAVAAMLAILVGVWTGFSAPATSAGRHAAEPLLHPNTLAGSYLTMVTGGTR